MSCMIVFANKTDKTLLRTVFLDTNIIKDFSFVLGSFFAIEISEFEDRLCENFHHEILERYLKNIWIKVL